MNLTVAMEEYKRSMLKLVEIEKERLDTMEMDVDDVNDIHLIRETKVELEAAEMLIELVLAYGNKLNAMEKKLELLLETLNK